MGMAFAMALTSSRLVTSGFYRVHLYVLLGTNVLATMIAWTHPDQFRLWPPLVIAALCYLGAAFWLYEKSRTGTVILYAVAGLSMFAAAVATAHPPEAGPLQTTLILLDILSSGLLLGFTLTAMFLGHWYLNTPTMELVPLRRLVMMLMVAILARAALCALGLGLVAWHDKLPQGAFVFFIALRWLSGLVGTLILAVMTWETLKIPNTQSATGILYVAVICAFLGELTAQLLSVQTMFPV